MNLPPSYESIVHSPKIQDKTGCWWLSIICLLNVIITRFSKTRQPQLQLYEPRQSDYRSVSYNEAVTNRKWMRKENSIYSQTVYSIYNITGSKSNIHISQKRKLEHEIWNMLLVCFDAFISQHCFLFKCFTFLSFVVSEMSPTHWFSCFISSFYWIVTEPFYIKEISSCSCFCSVCLCVMSLQVFACRNVCNRRSK